MQYLKKYLNNHNNYKIYLNKQYIQFSFATYILRHLSNKSSNSKVDEGNNNINLLTKAYSFFRCLLKTKINMINDIIA